MSFRSGHDTKGASRESTAKGCFPAETVKFLWTVTGTHIEDSRRLWYDIGKSISIAFVEVFCAVMPEAGSSEKGSPYTPGGFRHSVSAYEIRAGGACRRPYTQNQGCVPPLIRPKLRFRPLSSGMTVTGSHGYFYSLCGAQPPGEGYFPHRRKSSHTC